MGKTEKFNPEQYPIVEVEMNVRAPLSQVWRVWSEPEFMRQWFGPEGYSCPEAKMEFREGGRYTIAMKGPEGKVNWSAGEFREILQNERIVYTDHFSDENGKAVDPAIYGMPGNWPANTFVTVEFARANGGATLVKLRHEGIPAEMHDDCVQGWTSTLEKMKRVAQQH